ncbi:MAG: hypothetical protein HRT90_05330, partial [Candidatus Margulisbacteria bacterium]|nr:hypothetical protein [Candidatus Margulisiibacteriota bacterium]
MAMQTINRAFGSMNITTTSRRGGSSRPQVKSAPQNLQDLLGNRDNFHPDNIERVFGDSAYKVPEGDADKNEHGGINYTRKPMTSSQRRRKNRNRSQLLQQDGPGGIRDLQQSMCVQSCETRASVLDPNFTRDDLKNC